MHQGAISVIRQGQLFNNYYQRMIEKGKHHLWIINSIINMIAKCVFNLIKKWPNSIKKFSSIVKNHGMKIWYCHSNRDEKQIFFVS
jgi:hypothetical protein